MIKLIPAVKHMEIYSNFFHKKAVFYEETGMDSRLLSALKKLPYDKAGAKLDICIAGHSGEGYELSVNENDIRIQADGPAGAFYAVQTLRQIFKSSEIPCLYIKDFPDFEYRGFYHDVTRGKIPTVETIKKLIDQMAYYKLNSLQLYVEHTFEFEEYKDLNASTGCLTKEDLLEIGAYCRENFIDFVPSLSTFGHLYELLEQPQYKHLRVLKNYETLPNFWYARMRHHTLDPENPQSIALVESLIDQYISCFDSEWFNICCDETFDLHTYDALGIDSGKLYVEFVKKIIDCVQKRDKKVMIWADILLKYPHTMDQIPDHPFFPIGQKSDRLSRHFFLEQTLRTCGSGRAEHLPYGGVWLCPWRKGCAEYQLGRLGQSLQSGVGDVRPCAGSRKVLVGQHIGRQ